MTYKETFNKFLQRIKDDGSSIDIKKLEEAFILASEAHMGQYRKSGEDYINHPIEVAEILYDLKMDTDTIVAGILHDVAEDTLITIGDIRYIFGNDVANLVDGVTKLRNLPKSKGKQSENIRKMVVAMSQDIRVVVIKLADRIHNMRTIEFQSVEKQKEKSKESLEIFAPIAHRIGMSKLKAELEDISFRYLEPEEYQKIKKYVNAKKEERDNLITKTINFLDGKLKENNIKNYTIKGRAKHLYSIYKKMNDKGKKFVELTDLLAIRILTEKETDCYMVLGIVHSAFKPIISRFKDYISVPKSNGYKSIHTTVLIPDFLNKNSIDQQLEVQIRTYEMHDIAENGVAAHWKYKEKKSIDKNENFYADVRKMVENVGSDNFAQKITEQVLNETIFVLTPKDEVREIDANSTVLDFAFLIHTQIGYKTIGAKINDKIVPLDTILKNGDKVEILTSTTAKGPGKDWINMVSLNSSKTKIRKWFNDKEFEEKSKLGLAIIEKEFNDKVGIRFKEVIDDPRVILFIKKYNLKNIEQLAFKVYEGTVPLNNLIGKFEEKKEISVDEILEKHSEKVENNRKKIKNDSGIIISGADNISIIFSKCCHPFPGDDIKGYVSNGKGIMIHKSNCRNLVNTLTQNPKKEVEVRWNNEIIEKNKNKYPYSFKITTNHKNGILLSIVKLINDLKIDLDNIQGHNKGTYNLFNVVILIRSKEEFERLQKSLLKLNEVIDVETS